MYKVIYTAFQVNRETGTGVAFTTTDKRTLADKTGLGYDNLVRVFTRKRLTHFSGPNGWEVVKSFTHEKGPARNKIGNLTLNKRR